MVKKVMVTQDASCATESNLQDASCGPDEQDSWRRNRSWPNWCSYGTSNAGSDQQWYWPWWNKGRENAEVETNQSDLLTAAETQQQQQDEAYIRNYYEKRAEKRKRHNENRREHVWQASERIAMGENDFPARSTTTAEDSPDDSKQGTNLSPNTEQGQTIDKNSSPCPQQELQPQLNSKSTTLKDSILAVAANLDEDRAFKCRKTGDAASGSGLAREQTLTLDGPYWSMDQLQPPMDHTPEQPIQKCFPQPRTAGYNRLTPKLNGRYAGGAKIVKPPFGIQLIESFRLWREEMSRQHA